MRCGLVGVHFAFGVRHVDLIMLLHISVSVNLHMKFILLYIWMLMLCESIHLPTRCDYVCSDVCEICSGVQPLLRRCSFSRARTCWTGVFSGRAAE